MRDCHLHVIGVSCWFLGDALGDAYMSEWEVVSVLVAFVIGFVSGLLYALRLYKRIEANSDREWAKRLGMREMTAQYGDLPDGDLPDGDLPARINPILRRQKL